MQVYNQKKIWKEFYFLLYKKDKTLVEEKDLEKVNTLISSLLFLNLQ
jgi:hypothetical protein